MDNQLSPEAQQVYDEALAAAAVAKPSPHQLAQLADYATQVARLADARHRINRDGLVVADEKGRPIPHPALAIEQALSKHVASVYAKPWWTIRPRT